MEPLCDVSGAPVVRLVHAILANAILKRADTIEITCPDRAAAPSEEHALGSLMFTGLEVNYIFGDEHIIEMTTSAKYWQPIRNVIALNAQIQPWLQGMQEGSFRLRWSGRLHRFLVRIEPLDGREMIRLDLWSDAEHREEQAVELPTPTSADAVGDQLLANMFTDRNASAARELYRDWLIEQGDDRSKVLRCAEETSSDHSSEDWLSLEISRDWLGEIKTISAAMLCQRDFGAWVATSADSSPKSWPHVIRERHWRSVRGLWLECPSPRIAINFLEQAPLDALEHMMVSELDLISTALGGSLPALKTLGFSGSPDSVERALLLMAEGLAGRATIPLRRLAVNMSVDVPGIRNDLQAPLEMAAMVSDCGVREMTVLLHLEEILFDDWDYLQNRLPPNATLQLLRKRPFQSESEAEPRRRRARNCYSQLETLWVSSQDASLQGLGGWTDPVCVKIVVRLN